MKILKKIALLLVIILVLSSLGGYIYFDQKFTPEKNYLTVQNQSGPVNFKWLGNQKNFLLLPIHFENDTTKYYLQFDTGSPYTVFYYNTIKEIPQIAINKESAKTTFFVGKTKITSNTFKIYNLGKGTNKDSLKVIGTIGADILENRRTIINFREDHIVLNLDKTPPTFENKVFDFSFKKRKIMLKGFLKDQEEDFLFDSGTSAYELLTNKEVWTDLKLPNSKINIEKSKSWKTILTTYTTQCNQKIRFKNQEVQLNHVTYVEGFSQVQYLMMKLSGMTGMLGNKIFLNNCIYIDCTKNQMGIE